MNWNPAAFSNFPFPVSAKSHVWQENPELGEAARDFGKLYLQIYEKKKYVETDVRRVLQRYPDVPGLQFLLAECVAQRNKEEAERILQTMIEEHPESLFSKTVELCWTATKDRPTPSWWIDEETIPDFQDCFPDRKCFHAFEVFIFDLGATYAYQHRSQMDAAMDRIDPWRASFQGDLFCNVLEEADQHMKQQSRTAFEDQYEVPASWIAEADDRKWERLHALESDKKPQFKTVIAHELHHTPVELSPELQAAFDSAHQEDLLDDMEESLRFSLANYEYLHERDVDCLNVFHALILLSHHQRLSSVPTIITFLQQPDEVLQYFLGDVLTEDLCTWLANILERDIHAFDVLLRDPDANCYARAAVLEGMQQIALHFPERSAKIVAHLTEMLDLINAIGRKDISLPEINAEFAIIATNLKDPAFLAKIEDLYQQNRIDLSLQGDWEECLEYYNSPLHPHEIKPLHLRDLVGMYEELDWLLK